MKKVHLVEHAVANEKSRSTPSPSLGQKSELERGSFEDSNTA